jgi:putative ABC transport system permease protein
MTVTRAVVVFGLTTLMCAISGILAVRKVHRADPAELF